MENLAWFICQVFGSSDKKKHKLYYIYTHTKRTTVLGWYQVTSDLFLSSYIYDKYLILYQLSFPLSFSRVKWILNCRNYSNSLKLTLIKNIYPSLVLLSFFAPFAWPPQQCKSIGATVHWDWMSLLPLRYPMWSGLICLKDFGKGKWFYDV